MSILSKFAFRYMDVAYPEVEVGALLSFLSESKTIIPSYLHINFPFDFKIADDIEAIGLHKNAYVEIKRFIYFDTFETLRRQISSGQAMHLEIKEILIVYIHNRFPDTLLAQYINKLGMQTGLSIRFMSMDELREIVLKAKNFIPSSTVNHNFIVNTNVDIQDQLIEAAKKSINENNVTLFLGAGVSASAGIIDWDSLLKSLINQNGHSIINKRDINSIKAANNNSQIIIGRYIRCADPSIHFPSAIQKILYQHIKHSDLIDNICRLVAFKRISSIITYNYDMLIENAMCTVSMPDKDRVTLEPIYGSKRINKYSVPVYHVHGIIPDPTKNSSLPPDIILTEDEYHHLYFDSYDWSNIEQLHALDRNTCIFIGMSMNDPNLRRLLDFSNKSQDKGTPCHYAFLKREFFTPSKRHNSKKDCKNWQILESMLMSMGVNIIWFNEFKDLPKLIEKLYK